ncbi:unnamed protein product [Brachionus calyciflorus]|uniref:C2H2-type domain-containing protein n=1 Tax=Brachionus calyciflorus TaxID=104777 RepID=A0A814MXZ4_9BILA|nr:unnamed protein product [Brachionus calyciflorus]
MQNEICINKLNNFSEENDEFMVNDSDIDVESKDGTWTEEDLIEDELNDIEDLSKTVLSHIEFKLEINNDETEELLLEKFNSLIIIKPILVMTIYKEKSKTKLKKIDELMSNISIGPKKNALMLEKKSYDVLVSSKEADVAIGSLLNPGINSVKEYVCHECDTNGISKSFETEWGLKVHTSKMHKKK